MNSGNPTVASIVETAVLNHVRRFRFTLPHLVPRIVNQSRSSVEQAIDTLTRTGRVIRYSPSPDLNCLMLTKSRKPANSPTRRSLNTSLAAIYFCRCQSIERELLTAEDFKSHFPELYRPQHDRRYFLEHDSDPTRLGFIRIDHGGHGRWSRIIDKSRRDFEKHRRDSAFAPLIKQGWFEVHIVTATRRKALRVEQAIGQTRRRSDEVIRVTAIPELLPLMLTHRNFSHP